MTSSTAIRGHALVDGKSRKIQFDVAEARAEVMRMRGQVVSAIRSASGDHGGLTPEAKEYNIAAIAHYLDIMLLNQAAWVVQASDSGLDIAAYTQLEAKRLDAENARLRDKEAELVAAGGVRVA